ncbi:uncharacterized protein LOC128904316 isoform X2 [Rissa tridactyla]|uniref:uncharacterized protein LOC128904316 isoform X2 n=1 Tax=Rissa tridactyla TaxID=75485 RepID=UPI0023BA5587|nr:uncharacterized protein LOC128904316 isoform X2 [Rissa tridactyla]
MVATRSKAAVKKTVGTQTEAPHEHMGVQASGCRVCRSLAVATEGSGDNTCVRCEQCATKKSLALSSLPLHTDYIVAGRSKISTRHYFLQAEQTQISQPFPSITCCSPFSGLVSHPLDSLVFLILGSPKMDTVLWIQSQQNSVLHCSLKQASGG